MEIRFQPPTKLYEMLKQGEADKQQTQNQKSRQPAASAEQQETSRLLQTVQQELERLENSPEPERAEKLQTLKEKIDAGEYQVDSETLASFMLDERV